MTTSSVIQTPSPWSEFKSGLFRQKSAIWALVFKEFKIKLGKSRLGLLWVLIEPIVGMSMISAVWLFIGQEEIEGVHVTLFIGTGFVIFIAVRLGINHIPRAIESNRALLNYPQVKPFDTIIARFIEGMWLHAIASCCMLLALWWFVDTSATFPDPLVCIEAIGVAMLLSLGIAMPLAVYGTFYEGVFKTITIISQPLMILSAVMYSMNDLPTAGRDILSWNPIIHIVESFRHGAFGTRLFTGHNLAYPALLGLFLLGFGSIAYFVNRFRLLQE